MSSPRAPQLPAVYSAAVLVVGLSLTGALVFAGLQRWPWAPVLFVGAAAQTAFRIGKRAIRTRLVGREGGAAEETDDDHTIWAAVEPALAVFTFMVPVCALWYGLGRLLHWLLS
jgi:hypothetical protein